jgi:DNA-binding IclR family transcriptional regulator
MTPKVTRGEIENLCILHAVGDQGCPLGELPERLGLSPTLVVAVAESLTGLLGMGWLTREDETVTQTEEGRAWLGRRLLELGVG